MLQHADPPPPYKECLRAEAVNAQLPERNIPSLPLRHPRSNANVVPQGNKAPENRQPITPSNLQPSVTNSSINNNEVSPAPRIAESSYSVNDPSITGKRVYDRTCWKDKDNVDRMATILWIGRLKGHTSIYAGVEFDDEVGEGTGVFMGEEVFNAKNGHAGFILLDALRAVYPRPTINKDIVPAREQGIYPAASVSHPVKPFKQEPATSLETVLSQCRIIASKGISRRRCLVPECTMDHTTAHHISKISGNLLERVKICRLIKACTRCLSVHSSPCRAARVLCTGHHCKHLEAEKRDHSRALCPELYLELSDEQKFEFEHLQEASQ